MKNLVVALVVLGVTAVSAAPLRVALSYDDGFKDHHEIVAPILEKYGLRGTFNIITEKVGQGRHLTWDDARDLVRRGHDLASHTVSHPNLVDLLAAGRTNEVVRQVSDSRDAIEREIRKAVPEFRVAQVCHPYVAHNAAVDALIRAAGLEPMTAYRVNFGNLDKGDVSYNGRWLTTEEYLNEMIAEGRTDIDILCHGVRESVGWEPFRTPADFERHVATIARFRDEGRIVVVPERTLRRTPGSVVVWEGWPHPEQANGIIRRARSEGDTGPWTVIVRKGSYELSGPLVFTPDDSGVPGQPVRWVGENGARLVANQPASGRPAVIEFRGESCEGRSVSDLRFERLTFVVRQPAGGCSEQVAAGIGAAVAGAPTERVAFEDCRVSNE